MTRLIVGTDGEAASQALVEYLGAALGTEDVVHLVNSLEGGDETTAADVEEGEAALELLETGLAETGADVRTHQFVRGKAPVEDLLAAADEFEADEYVIGVRKRTPLGKIVFGSTAQNLLLEADRTVRCVPLT